jgi:MFS family permease
VILLNALSYAAPIWSLRHLDVRLLASPAGHPRQPKALREGFRYLLGRPDLLVVLAAIFVAGTFGLNFQMTSALMATEVFGKGAGEYGALGSIMAIGSLAGALLAARRQTVRLRLVLISGAVFGAAVVLSGLMPTYLTFAVLTPLLGVSALTLITSANMFMQLNTAPEVRGRVMAFYLMVFMGGTPVGAPLIGWIGEEFGARWTLVGGGMITLVGIVAAGLVHARLERARRDHGRSGKAPRGGARLILTGARAHE